MTAVVDFVTVKAPKNNKDQQAWGAKRQDIQSKPLISTQFQQISTNGVTCEALNALQEMHATARR